MDILKSAGDWAKVEMMSNGVFIVAGALFLASSLMFWQMGRTDTARGFVIPFLVAGGLLLILGGGLMFGTWQGLSGASAAVAQDRAAFAASEMARVEATMAQYSIAVFKVMPGLIAVAALVFLGVQGAVWRASMVTVMAVLCVIMIVDSNAYARLATYRLQLLQLASG